MRLRGYRVLGRGRDVVDVALAQDAELVILAVSSGPTRPRGRTFAPECAARSAASGH
jgi:hypothetical protein